MFSNRHRRANEESKPSAKLTRYANFMAEIKIHCLKCDKVRDDKIWVYRSDEGRVFIQHTCKHCDKGA